MINAIGAYFKQINYLLLIKVCLLGLLVAILTFPDYNLVYSTGIDPSLSWVFNSLFYEGSSLAKDFIFPHGPLAFFMYPTPENAVLVVVVTILLKILVFMNVKIQLADKQEKSWLTAFIITYFLCLVTGFTHLLLVNILLLYVNYFRSRKQYFKVLAFFLTAFAFYVKSYVAILSGMLCFSFVFIEFFSTYDWKRLAINVALVVGFLLLFWLLLFHTVSGFVKAIFGMIQLAGDNSSAVAYYPVNNWWFLSIYLLSFLGLFLLNRHKDTYIYFSLIALSLFGAWKHGMARLDGSHVEGMWSYSIIVLSVFVLYFTKNRLQNALVAIVAIVFLGANMKNAEGYSPARFELFKANNFFHFVGNYSSIVKDAKQTTQSNISENILPATIRNEIGEQTVDIYPWDYSIIPANKLNWKPRPVLHSYAAYTSWLDEQNAKHINSDKAAEYFLWKVNETPKGLNGNAWNSIDNRYLLNDEPQSMLAFISHYHPVLRDGEFLLFKRNKRKLELKKNTIKTMQTSWNEWIAVPSHDGEILRAKVHFEKSFLLTLKSAIYKDEQYWVDLKLTDESIHHYRFVPKNAADGLWINPYTYDLNTKKWVKEIRFRSFKSSLLSSQIEVQWESVSTNKTDFIDHFFTTESNKEDSLIQSVQYDFSDNQLNELISKNKVIPSNAPRDNGQTLDTNEISDILTLSLDSLQGNFSVTFGCHIKAVNYQYADDALIIIAIHRPSGNNSWNSISIDHQLINGSEQNWVIHHQNFLVDEAGVEVRLNIWNNSSHPIHVDDFTIHLYKRS